MLAVVSTQAFGLHSGLRWRQRKPLQVPTQAYVGVRSSAQWRPLRPSVVSTQGSGGVHWLAVVSSQGIGDA